MPVTSRTIPARFQDFCDLDPVSRELHGTVGGISIDVDDATLLHQARNGDQAAFGEIFQRHQRPIFRYAVRMCGHAAADDIVQDAFMIVLRRGDRFDASRGTFGAFLFGIARHLVLKQLGARYEAPLDDEIDVADAGTQPTILETLTQQERVCAVRAAVQSLPPVYREVVALCDLEELDYVTTAAMLGCPIGTVRSRLHRARALLVSKLMSLRTAARIE